MTNSILCKMFVPEAQSRSGHTLPSRSPRAVVCYPWLKRKKHDQKLTFDSKVGLLQESGHPPWRPRTVECSPGPDSGVVDSRWFLGMLAEGQGIARPVPDALAMVERTTERFYAAELHRLRGLFLAQEGAGEEAETHSDARFVHRARAASPRLVAQGGDESRAAVGGARPAAEVHDLLAPIYS
jgi:hypothetical protein